MHGSRTSGGLGQDGSRAISLSSHPSASRQGYTCLAPDFVSVLCSELLDMRFGGVFVDLKIYDLKSFFIPIRDCLTVIEGGNTPLICQNISMGLL